MCRHCDHTHWQPDMLTEGKGRRRDVCNVQRWQQLFAENHNITHTHTHKCIPGMATWLMGSINCTTSDWHCQCCSCCFYCCRCSRCSCQREWQAERDRERELDKKGDSRERDSFRRNWIIIRTRACITTPSPARTHTQSWAACAAVSFGPSAVLAISLQAITHFHTNLNICHAFAACVANRMFILCSARN